MNGLIEQHIRQTGGWSRGQTITYNIVYHNIPMVYGSDSDTSVNSYSGTVKIYMKTASNFRIAPNASDEILNAEIAFYCSGY